MNKTKKTSWAPLILRCCLWLLGAAQVAALMVASERPAHAYVDPGSGYVFLQLAGSMFAGALYYLRHHVKRILGLPRRASTGPTPDGAAEVAENQP